MELLVYQKEKSYFKFNAFLMISLIMMSLLLFSTFAQARTPANMVRDLKKAAKSSVTTWSSPDLVDTPKSFSY